MRTIPDRARAPWNKYKWNRLSHWSVNNKVCSVARRMVNRKGASPALLHRTKYVSAILARGLIVYTQYGQEVPGSEYEFFDVVNPVLWDAEVEQFILELDAETRLLGEREIL